MFGKVNQGSYSEQMVAYVARTAYEVSTGSMAVLPIFKGPRVTNDSFGNRFLHCTMGYKNKHPMAQMGFERFDVLWKFVAQVEPFHDFGWTLSGMNLTRTSNSDEGDETTSVYIDDFLVTYVFLPPYNAEGDREVWIGTSFRDREKITVGKSFYVRPSITFFPQTANRPISNKNSKCSF